MVKLAYRAGRSWRAVDSSKHESQSIRSRWRFSRRVAGIERLWSARPHARLLADGCSLWPGGQLDGWGLRHAAALSRRGKAYGADLGQYHRRFFAVAWSDSRPSRRLGV